MPVFSRDDVHLHYTERGEGPAILLLAPGGMRSHAGLWAGRGFDPRTELPGYRVIAMDQRNAGASTAPVRAEDGWETYAADQLALLDHLGVERATVIGMCIGGAFVAALARLAPARLRAAVMFQPIGLDENRPVFHDLFDGWAAAIAPDHPEADAATWAAFRERMWSGSFMFAAKEADVAAFPVPLLLFGGDDIYHPRSTSQAIARLAPDVVFVEGWKADPVGLAATLRGFLARTAGADS